MTDARALYVPSESEVRDLTNTVYASFHYDFRNYSMASLKRRVAAAIGSFGCDDVRGLLRRIDEDEHAFARLLSFLTVQVSEMFRDPTYWRSFREQIVPELRTYPSIRIWVAGCSAGEEAYSFAVILKEEGLLERSLIYATDIHVEALAKAEAGIFALERIKGFAESHRQSGARLALSEHYAAGADAAVFDRSLRARMVFSDHSLSTDNVFAEVQLVSCRNVLIYFDRILQSRALGLFHESLCRRGFLGLGSKESVQFSAHANAFIPFVQEDRWYRRA